MWMVGSWQDRPAPCCCPRGCLESLNKGWAERSGLVPTYTRTLPSVTGPAGMGCPGLLFTEALTFLEPGHQCLSLAVPRGCRVLRVSEPLLYRGH